MIGKLLSYVRAPRNGAKQADIKLDTGGGDIRTATHAQGSGDDAVPLPGDYTINVHVDRSGGVFTVGFVEPDATQTAQAGERRLYSRGADRVEVAQIWLKNDGTVLISNAKGSHELRPDGSQRSQNAAGYYELQAGGTVDINTATIDPSGNIIATSVTAPSIIVDGKELKNHKHNGVTAGGAQTGPNV